MLRTPVTSGQIVSIGHNPATNQLHVEFRGGSVYEYDNVSADLHQEILGFDKEGKKIEGHSLGGTFTARIKRDPETYPYRKLDPKGEAK